MGAQINVDIFFADWEKPTGARNPSIWRKIFVVEKWKDLELSRGINVSATLFILVFLLEGMGLK